MNKKCGCIFDNFDLQLIIIIHFQIIYIDEMSEKFSTDSLVPVTHQTSANIHSSNCEICEYCSSPALIQHSEGFTCLDCSRATLGVYHTDTIELSHDNNLPYHKYPEEILSEITCRVGISQCVKDRTIQLFLLAKNRFKTKSNIDLILISIYQSYRERRIFISFYRLKEYYYTQSSISILNLILLLVILCLFFF